MRRANWVDVPCALCDAMQQTRRLYQKYEFDIVRCRRCGLVYVDPRGAEADILQRYSAQYFCNEYLPATGLVPGGEPDLLSIDRHYGPMLEFLARRQPAGRRLLEIGSGGGLFLKAAQRAGWTVAGTELSDAASAFARDRLQLDVRREDAEAITWTAGSFDVVAMFDVIEHLFRPRKVLDAARRMLSPRGVLVVVTPNFNALSRLMLGRHWTILSPLEHLYYFTESTLERMLTATGFQSVSFEREFAGWGPLETMNYRNTSADRGRRGRLYATLVSGVLAERHRLVQRAGRGDAILCVAS